MCLLLTAEIEVLSNTTGVSIPAKRPVVSDVYVLTSSGGSSSGLTEMATNGVSVFFSWLPSVATTSVTGIVSTIRKNVTVIRDIFSQKGAAIKNSRASQF